MYYSNFVDWVDPPRKATLKWDLLQAECSLADYWVDH